MGKIESHTRHTKEIQSNPIAARKDNGLAAIQAAIVNVAELSSVSGGGGLIQTTSGWHQQRVDRDHPRGWLWRACS